MADIFDEVLTERKSVPKGDIFDEVLSERQTKGGEQSNENAESKSDQGTRSQGDAQRTLDGKVNATNAPRSEGGGELRPVNEGQSQRIYKARVSTDSVEGGEQNGKGKTTQAEVGNVPQVGKEDGQGIPSKGPSGNQEEVKNAGGVQPSTTSKIIGAITAPMGYLSESTVGAISGIQKALGMDKQAEESALMASTAVEDWASTFGGTPVRGGAGETAAKIGAGILELPALALTGTAGIAGMLAQGFGGAKKDLYEKYKQEGLTDEEANKKSSTHAAITTAAALPAYYLGGRIAGKAADAFISESAPKLLNAAGRLGMNAVANGVASAAVRGFAAGIEGEDPIKAAKDVSLEGSIQDVLFAAHSTAEHFKAKAAEGKAQEAATEVSDAMLDVLAKKPEYADIANEEIQRRSKLKVSQEAETTDLPITASAVQQGNILPEVAKFEEAPAKPISLEPITPEAPKEEVKPPVSVAGEAPAVEPTAEMVPTPGVLPGGKEPPTMAPKAEYEKGVTELQKLRGNEKISLTDYQNVHSDVAKGVDPIEAAQIAENKYQAHKYAGSEMSRAVSSGEIPSGPKAADLYEQKYNERLNELKTAKAPAEAQPTKPSETEIQKTSGLPTLQRKPSVGEAEVKAEGGVAQGKREGEKEVTIPEGARVAAAAYLAPDGKTYEGSSHLDAMQKAKEAGAITQAEIDAKQSPESRNTEEFGYAITLPDGTRTTTTREAGGKIAKSSGQAKVEEYQFGEKAHSNEIAKDDFPETGAKEVPPTEAAKEIPPAPEGGETVMRGVSERIAESKETSPAQKYFIEADELVKRKVLPDEVADEWVESVPSENLEETFNKAMESIGSDENLSRLRVRLGSRLSSEKFAKGDDAGGAEIINRIAQTASDAASVLRSVQFLYKTSPKGFVKVAEKLADKAGVKLKSAATQRVQELANDFLGKRKLHEELANRVQNATTKKEFKDALREMKKAQSDALKSQNKLFGYVDSILPKSFSKEVYPSLLKGNLLTPISLATNIQANALRTLIDTPSMLFGSGVDTAKSLLTGKPREFVFGPEEVYQYWKTLAKEAPDLVKNTIKSFTGQDLDIGKVTDKAEIKRRLSPLSAIKRLVSSDKNRLYEGEYTLGNRAADFAESTFGIPANLMFDLLAVGDKPFREASKRMTASSIARQIGLKGLDYQKFIELPEQGIKAYAKKVGKDAADSAKIKNNLLQDLRTETSKGVFEQENKVADAINKGLNYLDKVPVVNVIARATIPYVKTPINVIDEIMQYTVWPYSLAKTFSAFKKGNTKEAQQLMGKVTIGMIVSYAGTYLYKQGVLSAPADPRSKEQELGYATMPTGSINISGIQRLMNGENGLPQAGDKIIRADKLGVLGGILVTSAIRSKKREESKLMGEDQSLPSRVANEVAAIVPKVLAYSLNQTFLKGSNDLLQSLVRGEGDKWMKGVFGAASSAFIPNTLSAVSRATREYMPDVQDDSFYKSMSNAIKDRFGFAGAMKDVMPRIDFWGREVRQTPEGADPVLYNFVDMSKSRDIPNDPVSLELMHLFYRTKDKEIIPSSPQKTYTIKSKTYGLTPEEYNSYAKLIGENRYNQVERLVSSPSYLKMTDERKMNAFKDAISRGTSIGKNKFERQIKEAGGPKGEVKKLSPKEMAQQVRELRDSKDAEIEFDSQSQIKQ